MVPAIQLSALALALRIFEADQPSLGWTMAGYAGLVSVATIYGRYHFTVDVLAGFAVSVGAALPIGGLWCNVQKHERRA